MAESTIKRVKITYEQGGVQANEVYWSQPCDLTTNGGAAAFVNQVQQLIELRSDLMFTTHEWVSIEISDVTDPRKSILVRVGETKAIPAGTNNTVTIPEHGNIGLTASIQPEQMRVPALVELTFDNGTRRSRRYMSTVPDDVTAYDPRTINRTSKSTWWTGWAAWAQWLAQGYWQVYGLRHDGIWARKDVAKLIPAAPGPGLMALQLKASDVTPEWLPGVVIQVEGFRAFPGKCPCPTINGQWTIDSVQVGATGLVYLAGSTSIDPTNWKRMGTASLIGHNYFIVEAADVIGSATRKRGNGSRHRGKSKARCCGR